MCYISCVRRVDMSVQISAQTALLHTAFLSVTKWLALSPPDFQSQEEDSSGESGLGILKQPESMGTIQREEFAGKYHVDAIEERGN